MIKNIIGQYRRFVTYRIHGKVSIYIHADISSWISGLHFDLKKGTLELRQRHVHKSKNTYMIPNAP